MTHKQISIVTCVLYTLVGPGLVLSMLLTECFHLAPVFSSILNSLGDGCFHSVLKPSIAEIVPGECEEAPPGFLESIEHLTLNHLIHCPFQFCFYPDPESVTHRLPAYGKWQAYGSRVTLEHLVEFFGKSNF